MTDDKNKLGYQDRSRVSGDEEYEVGYVASKFGLSVPQVRELIASTATTATRCNVRRRTLRVAEHPMKYQVEEIYGEQVVSSASSWRTIP